MTALSDWRNVAVARERKKVKQAGLGRREFLRSLGASAGAAAAGAGTFPRDAGADSESNDEKRKARYRVTEDVKNYYRVNRYPS
jgi:hypothetical protein